MQNTSQKAKGNHNQWNSCPNKLQQCINRCNKAEYILFMASCCKEKNFRHEYSREYIFLPKSQLQLSDPELASVWLHTNS